MPFPVRRAPALAAGMIVLTFAALPSAPARADRQADAAAIRAAYSEFDESFKRLDMDAVTALFAPKY